jgi:hypothetical protein
MGIMTRLRDLFSSKHKRGKGELEALWGMTTPNERHYLADYAQRLYTGKGAIVDLGSWLGSLTVPLLLGLKENPAPAAKKGALHAYDLFEWQDWMNPYQPKGRFRKPLKSGDSFLPEFVRRVSPFDTERRLLIHAGDLGGLGWCGRPIEMLVVDVMKSWDLANCVVRDFFPSLMPGQSYVFHQDFCHHYTTWIHLIHYRLRDHFEKVVSLADAATIVFKYTKPFPAEVLRHTYSFDDFSEAEFEAAFEFSLSQVEPDSLWQRQAILAAKVMAFIHKQDLRRARQELEKITARGLAIDGELKIVQAQLAQ